MATGASSLGAASGQSSSTRSRRLFYILLACAAPAIIAAVRPLSWKGNAELHTLAEAVANGAALTAASMALVRYYTKKERKFLLIGSGFIGAFFLDGYHAAITSAYFAKYTPSTLSALTPWSGATSRMFLSLLMLASALTWREGTEREATKRQEALVYLLVGAWTLISFVFFAVVSLRLPYYPHFFLHRPLELVPCTLFAIAAVRYWSLGLWKADAFEHWLILSLIAAAAANVALSVYGGLFDVTFFLAHGFKIAQYVLVLCGLYVSMYSIFRREADNASRLGQVNSSLAGEIEERHKAEAELRRAHEELDSRVRARTRDLAVANDALSGEIAERTRAEQRLTSTNGELQNRTEELERQTHEMELLAQLASALRACADPQEAEAVVAKVLALAFPHCGGAIYILDNCRNLVQPSAQWGPRTDASVFAPDQCCALRTGRVHLGDGKQLLDCAHVRGQQFYLCVPLVGQGEILGTISMQSESLPDLADCRLVSDPTKLVQTMAEQVAMALSGLRLRQVLREAAIRDPLTGLFNRRYMEETFSRELARCKRNHTPISVMMIDIDHFKTFNDRHGHEVGDLVLEQAGALLRSTVRAEDIVCRLGGEEFLVIMAEAALPSAMQRANLLKAQFSSMCINHNGRAIEAVTVSVGIASTETSGYCREELMRTADQCLYLAKSQGRNRVCANPPESVAVPS
jgi:diguanylate cyclase (GGDEF)-like protein